MKIKYSALVSGARNKLNGSVASRNRYGDYFRNKTTPVNPRTQYQQNVRAFMATNARAWRDLTADQRSAWNAAAPSRPFTDIFGDKQIYSGFNLFMKINQQMLNFGQPTIADVPPNEPAPSDLRGITVAIEGSVITLTTTAPPAEGQLLIVYAAANYSAGKSYTKNLQKFIQAFPGDITQPIELNAAIEERFGSITEGTGITVRAAAYSPIAGLLGIPYQDSIIFEPA